MAQDMAPQDIPERDRMRDSRQTKERAATPGLFELTSFLAGHTRAWGIFEDRFGRVRRRLAVEMHGRWQDDVFVLNERFVYDGTETEFRTWRVTDDGDGHFRGTCDDCVGEARGTCGPDSVRMSYRFRLKLESREIVVHFDDRLHRVGETMAVNRAIMSKWGVRLGELSLFFERLVDDGAREQADQVAA